MLYKRLVSFGAAVLFTALITATSAAIAQDGQQSTSGKVQVTANVPKFIVLHYYSSLTLNFEQPTSAALDQGDNTMSVSWTGTTSGGGELSEANLMTAKTGLETGVITVTIPKIWAVRGFSDSGNAEVSVSISDGGDKLTRKNNTVESVIEMSNVVVSDGVTTGSTIKTNLGGISKSSTTPGGVQLDLDFRQTKLSGSHSGGGYTITASTI